METKSHTRKQFFLGSEVISFDEFRATPIPIGNFRMADREKLWNSIEAVQPDVFVWTTWLTPKIFREFVRADKKRTRKARLIRENRCKR